MRPAATPDLEASEPGALGERPVSRPRSDLACYAALDLGTNNCRLLIATPREHGFRVVDAFSRIVRLGEGVGQSGVLGRAAMDRAVEALKICAAKLADRNLDRARQIATEACRVAANRDEFVGRVREETGLVIEIVSQEIEARLAVAGCASLVDSHAHGVILFDIGGGSSELVWIDLAGTADGRRRRMADRVRSWMSLPVGVVNVSERHGGRHVSRESFEAMVAEVALMLGAFPEIEALDAAVAGGRVHMLGTSGTVTTLAGVHLGLPRYDRRRVDGIWLSGGEVASLVGTLAAMDYDTRVANPCIGRDRADLVLAGCAILEAFRRRWPCERLRVADRGLREGVLVELMAEDGVWRGRSGQRGADRHA
jgi:exopolyphosphatase/guanosine-5'-triphosphate,3'-diphosphate pyrophosphatase